MVLSGFVRDLFLISVQNPSTPHTATGTAPAQPTAANPLVIELNFEEKIIGTYLSMIASCRLQSPKGIHDIDHLVKLQELCTRMQTPDIANLIPGKIQMRARSEPWAAFRLAVKREDLHLAKIAIKHFDSAPTCPAVRFPAVQPSDFNDLRFAWIHELFKPRYGTGLKENWWETPVGAPCAWLEVAEKFKPVAPTSTMSSVAVSLLSDDASDTLC